MHPVNRRVTTQYLHTQSVTTRPRCGRNGKHEAPVSCQLTGASASLGVGGGGSLGGGGGHPMVRGGWGGSMRGRKGN